MNSGTYSIAALVSDLKAICAEVRGEREILSAVRPLARKAALSSETWLEDRMREVNSEQGFGVTLLHEEPDHSIAILAVSWGPQKGTPPHDHGTWAVVAGVEGEEINEFFERPSGNAAGERAPLRRIGKKVCAVGEVVAMPGDMIHGVYNGTDRVTVSLHVYGKNINYTGRSQFDPGSGEEKPFLLQMTD